MGGPPTPGIGFGIGHRARADRLRRRRRVRRRTAPRVDAFVVDGLGADGDVEVACSVAELRENGLRAERAYGDRSVKAQWKAADQSGAALRRDARARAKPSASAVAVKDLRSGEQVEVPRDALVGVAADDERTRAPAMMRTDRAGDLRADRHRPRRRAVRLGRQPSRPRRRRVPRRPRHRGHRAGGRRPRRVAGADGAPRARRVRRPRRGHGAAPARGHGQRRRSPPARSRSARPRSRC